MPIPALLSKSVALRVTSCVVGLRGGHFDVAVVVEIGLLPIAWYVASTGHRHYIRCRQ